MKETPETIEKDPCRQCLTIYRDQLLPIDLSAGVPRDTLRCPNGQVTLLPTFNIDPHQEGDPHQEITEINVEGLEDKEGLEDNY